MENAQQRTVLITGCSDDGIGAALAIALHKAGLHVYATARNLSKMKTVSAMKIETLQLDVLSADSIADCVKKVPKLDILINNAGAVFTMPVADLDISKAKELFDLNVWAQIAVTQAFLPLLMTSKSPLLVNHTSSAAAVTLPFQATYNASKAAISKFSDTLRFELDPFGVKVVELRTGIVKTNITTNLREVHNPTLPENSIYEPAREAMQKALRQDGFEATGTPVDEWAKAVAQDLLRKNPPPVIWRGESAWLVRLASVLPSGWFDGMIKKLTGMDKVEEILKKQKRI